HAGVAVGSAGGRPWEQACLGDFPLLCLPDLRAAVAWARSGVPPAEAGAASPEVGTASPSGSAAEPAVTVRLDEIKGQDHAKRALEIAAAGGHGVLLYGPPGTGKSLLARSLTGLLPPLSPAEAREVAEIYSAAGRRPPAGDARPFRDPHHSATRAALLGGGAVPEPGELSLAHRGVLFLDELPLFRRDAVDGLREPLEQGFVTINRIGRVARFPARFTLVAAANPCRCGHFGDDTVSCRCTEYELRRYWATLPGPVLDRIDLFVPVGRLSFDDVTGATPGGAAATAGPAAAGGGPELRVRNARRIQALRYRDEPIETNAEMGRVHLDRHALLEAGPREVLRRAYERYRLSVRAYDRILRVARTIADLDGSLYIAREHVLEALSYREVPLGRN
ncbi:MAG TPA: ATP-binding protein, partial [Bacillota bacterium]